MGKTFFQDMLCLLRWGFFQPAKLSDYMHSLHPDLKDHVGFSQQLWLAKQSPTVRRFLGLQFSVWVSLGLFSFLLMLSVRTMTSPARPFSWNEVGLEAVFGIVGSLMVAITLCAVGGVAVGVTGGAVGALLIGLSLGLAFGLIGVGTALVALGLAGGIVLGMIGPTFDHLRRPTLILSSWSYWGRAAVGFIFAAISVTLLGLVLGVSIGLTDIFFINTNARIALGVGFGLLGSLMLIASASLGHAL